MPKPEDRPQPAPPSKAAPVDPARQRSLVLLRDTRGSAATWAQRGLGPVTVVPGPAWTLVAPAGPTRSAAPYDDPATVLGGRPVPRRLRPAACLVAGPDRLTVQVQGPSWRAPRRWLVWTRGVGLSRVPDLEPAPLALVARLLAPMRDAGDRLGDVFARDGRLPAVVADALLESLGLPGAGVLSGRVDPATLPGAVRVEPQEHLVARFDTVALDEDQAARERGER
jgi:hypothetical protein